jgi:2,4-dienoyl-CoA reductase-like NADH-dependent reductase (Old Yellow Enzyme family)
MILKEGRITPEDVGLWKDSQIAPLKRVVDFAHSQVSDHILYILYQMLISATRTN